MHRARSSCRLSRTRSPLRLSASSTPAAIASLLLAAGVAHADIYTWVAGNGLWSTPSNWLPIGVPGSGDTVRIGNLAGVQNSLVVLDQHTGYGRLELSSGMTLDMNGRELVSFGEAWITGAGTRLVVRPHLGINNHDFQGTLRLGAGAILDLRDNAPVALYEDSWSFGTITGRGLVQMASPAPFRNDGTIRPDNNGGLTIQHVYGPIDLDGNVGNGHLLLDVPFSVLQVDANQLTDSFSGTLTMVPGSLLTMNIGSQWAADAGAQFNILGANNPAAASQINGSNILLGASVNLGASQAHLRILAPATVQASAVVELAPAAWLEFGGATTVNGGQFRLGQNAKLEFDGPTSLQGGSFETVSQAIGGGFIAFNGATQWQGGTVDINGVGRQNGNATVTAPTVINAGVLDLSGQDGNTQWTINSGLVIHAANIRAAPLGNGNSFTGHMNISGGFLGRLTLNLPGSSWTMAGVMNLAGTNPLYSNRLAGSPMTLTGELNISNSLVEATADLNVMPGATVNFAAPGSHLRLRGHTAIREDAVFTGAGMLVNGIGGQLTFTHAASLAQVGLLNQGTAGLRRSLSSDQPASASVDRFTNEGILRVRIGGHTPGTGHDSLYVTGGTAALGGQLQVELLNLGGGFAPAPGNQFTILDAPAGISGAFANDPTTVHIDGTVYDWTVLYTPTQVILRLDSITSCYANCDGSTTSPILNVADFSCFMQRFAAGDPYANCDQSTVPPVLNVADFSCFLQAFAAGCP
jgi:hypothetical protein